MPDLERIIDAILGSFAEGSFLNLHRDVLEIYSSDAVPRLLYHLEQNDLSRKKAALACLKFCWSPQAIKPVAACLGSDDREVRQLAVTALGTHEGVTALAKLCQPHLTDPRPEIAGFAHSRMEGEFPDLARTRRCLAQPALRRWMWAYLPRYYTPDLTDDTLKLLEHEDDWDAALAGIVALIHQNADSSAVRARITEFLCHPFEGFRELAAEYFMWHGNQLDTTELEAALVREENPYAKASMTAAQEAIGRRTKSDRVPADIPAETAGQSPYQLYSTALSLLDTPHGAGAWQSAINIYRNAELFEPHWAWRSGNVPVGFGELRELRLDVQARIFSIQGRAEESAGSIADVFDAPPADSLMPPMRDYFDPERTSYGSKMKENIKAFGGLVHVGDDLHWLKDHRTVVAIGNGVVRQSACTPSWGHIVVIEHRCRNGETFCSLYAHLSPFIAAAPGSIVRKGQKIGSIGRSFTWENGGYAAHLHFGIHTGPFNAVYPRGSIIYTKYEDRYYRGKVLRSDAERTVMEIHTPTQALEIVRPSTWIGGYVSTEQWDDGTHGWVDPQEFIRSKCIE